MKVARLNFNHREQIVSEPFGFAFLTNGCSLEEALFTAMPTFSRTEYVNACFCSDIEARVYTREDYVSTEGYPFSSCVSPRTVLTVDCRSVDIWMPVIEFRRR